MKGYVRPFILGRQSCLKDCNAILTLYLWDQVIQMHLGSKPVSHVEAFDFVDYSSSTSTLTYVSQVFSKSIMEIRECM